MNALWLENNQISLRDVPQPRKPNEALIKIRKAGICSTDLELVKGYYPYTGMIGHEFVGEVVVPSQGRGGRGEGRSPCGGEINVVCNQCEQCLNGRPTHCENRTVLGIVNRDGTFAEFTTLPIANLHRVPDSVPDEMAVFTEPLAAALEIQEQIQIKPTDRVLLVGAGRPGSAHRPDAGTDRLRSARGGTSCTSAGSVEGDAGSGSLLKRRSSPGDGMSWWKRPGRRAAFLWRGRPSVRVERWC